jgi:hypothetical protein
MAKKTRKQKQRAVARRPSPAFRPMTSGAPGAAAATGTAPAEPADDTDDADVSEAQPVANAAASVAVDIPTSDPGRRRVERVGAASAPTARPRSTRGQTQGYIQALESDDAAIPFDRVPYVPADLRRVAIIAGLMIVLIIVADIIVSNVVK